ncbi:MAG: hypothetical protein K1X82_10620 [Bacteroidia bacterium]|nr:hypothetical protein [Bacteroidia bacterium]
MQELTGLIKGLNKREIKLVRWLYTSSGKSEEKLRLQIFDYILKSKKAEEAEFRKKISYNGSNSAFSHLKRRLRNDILNVILLQESNKKFRAPMFTASFEVKKKMAFAELLYRRGQLDLGDCLIDEGIKLAKNFELIAEQYILTDFQRITQGITKGNKIIGKANNEIENIVEAISANSKVVNLFYDFTIRYLGKKSFSSEKLKEAQDSLVKMEFIYKNYPYARIGFWYHRAAISYYSQNHEYENAFLHGKLLLELTENNQALYTPVNLAGASKDLAEICISAKKFDFGVTYSNRALELFNPKLNNYLLTLENLFQSEFYLGNMENCKYIYNKAKVHPRYSKNKSTIAKWNYFNSCILFKEKKYRECLKSLNQFKQEYLSDKGEMQFGYRLLILINYIELEKFDVFEFELDSFRKSIYYYKDYYKERISYIIKTLNDLQKCDFDFSKFSKFEIENRIKNKWQPLGYEMVEFFEWLNKKFVHNEN